MAVTDLTTWIIQHFRTTDGKLTELIRQPRHGNHSPTVSSANMAEEQSEKTDEVMQQGAHTRPVELINERAQTNRTLP
jgi:hypothetical protein